MCLLCGNPPNYTRTLVPFLCFYYTSTKRLHKVIQGRKKTPDPLPNSSKTQLIPWKKLNWRVSGSKTSGLVESTLQKTGIN